MMDRPGRRDAVRQNVLLIGDDDIGLTSDRRRLESRGYHVVRASDPDVALDVARQLQPWAIFLTVQRPGSERTPFLVALRRDDRTRHIPVTVLARGYDDALEHIGLSRVGRDLW
jgi:CheY-like chemotaxis protein